MQKLFDIDLGNDFFLHMSPKHSSQNRKTDKYNHIIAKSLDSKGNTQQSEERTCEMAKNICKPHVFYYGLITTPKKKKKKKRGF